MRRALLAAVLILPCVSCSSVSVSSERAIGAPTFPPTRPESVEIRRRAPKQPHERLGEIYLEPSGSPSVEEMEAAIRTEAAKMGADAAVIVFDRTRRIGRVVEGPWWARSSYPVYGRKIVAVAIRYTGGRDKD
ncbi:MAG TPA: hypothetical protein VLO07_09925 [Thermoanaerobaculia bacterium]|nr:hypothetical protein [Thermoanaerobaculia bacterium]